MSKRISALLLAVVLVAGSVLNGNILKVKAASVAVSEDFAVELTMMIYNLLETVAISSGIKDGLDDYESGSSLYDAFIASVESMAEPPYYDTIITMEDGSKMTVKEALDAVESTLGSNALKLPTSETFAKYRVISGTGGSDPEPTPTPEPENTPTPDTGYTDPFRYIQDVLVTSTLFTAMAGFFADVYQGKIVGINPAEYYGTGECFSGKLEKNSDGNYVIRGYVNTQINLTDGTTYFPHYNFDSSYSFYASPIVAVYFETNNVSSSSGIYLKAYSTSLYNPRIQSFYRPYNASGNPMYSGSYNTGFSYSSTVGCAIEYALNIPVFDSEDHALAFCKTGNLTGLLNGEAYDFPDLATSTAERLQPLTGYEFAPGRLPGINAALSTAAAALPEPGLDPAENTEAYKKTLNAALTAALPEPAPEPEPDPDPSPSPDPGTGGEGESYKRDLKLLFPFCIPFDFIHLIQALKAEPETPKFEIPVKLDFVDVDTSIVIDLAWMDPIMKIWRLGELGLFIVMLMKSTSKVIRW